MPGKHFLLCLLLIASAMPLACTQGATPRHRAKQRHPVAPHDTASPKPAPGASAGNWRLVWADEFDKAGLPDPAKWNYEEGFVRNQEAQYYTRARKENARVEKGVLVIEARKEKFKNPRYRAGAKEWMQNREFAGYTAASLITRGIAEWTYGRVEVRAKLPDGKGMWPAIWMLGHGPWPRNGEIDIMEWWGINPTNVQATLHYGIGGKHLSNAGKLKVAKPNADFHVFAMEWFPDRMDFYFDHQKYHSFPNAKAQDGAFNPYRLPHTLLINFAMGGSSGGKIDDSKLPQKFLVDYVRIYQKK